jgi:hypothetical protein
VEEVILERYKLLVTNIFVPREEKNTVGLDNALCGSRLSFRALRSQLSKRAASKHAASPETKDTPYQTRKAERGDRVSRS